MNVNEVVATFDNTHNALRFEKTLKENQIKLTVMPVPREISASCGLAVKFDLEKYENISSLAADNEIMVKNYYQIIIEENKRRYFALK
jgi:hypothetical protein